MSGLWKAWPTAIALLVAAVLQVSLAPHLAVFGIVPNFILLVVITLAFVEGPVAGSLAGFAGGLMLDLVGDSIVGPWVLVLSVVGYGAGMLQAQMFAEGWLLPITVAAIAAFSAEVSRGIILAFLSEGTGFWYAFIRLMVPAALYNTALAVLFYPLLVRVLRQDKTIKSFRRLA